MIFIALFSRYGAKLTIANCDTDGHVFHLEFDITTCKWALLADTNEWKGTATQLCEATKEYHISSEYSPIGIAYRLRANDQILFSKYGIDVRHKLINNKKMIYLTKTNTDIR